MTWPIALAMLSFSAPIVAAIISRKPGNSAVTRREFDQFARHVNRRFDELQGYIRELRRFLNDRF